MHTLAAEPEPVAAVVPAPVTNRMVVAVLALIGILISAYMSAYAFGLFGQLMCGAGGCEVVQHSPWARLFGVPVAVIGLVGYAALFVTALLGVQPADGHSRGVPLVLAAGATIGLLFSAYLTYLEAFVIHAWCRWCVASAVLAVSIFLSTLPEFRRLRSTS